MIKEKQIITTRPDKSQVVNYNNPQFYCFAEKHFYSPGAGHFIPEHWHEDIEFFYILDGSFEFMVSGEHVHLNKGEGILVNSKRVHSNWSPKGEYCEFYCVIINPSYLCASSYIEQKYVAPVLSAAAPDYFLLSPNDWTAGMLSDIERLFEQSNPKTMELEIIETSFRVFRLLHDNIDFSSMIQPSSIYESTFKSMMGYIQEHYMEKISLEDIANSGNVGKTLCAKIFKHFVSKTPGDFLISFRITKSVDLLNTTDLSVTDIAYQTGFTSGSHYTKTFREMMGVTPSEYRGKDLSSGFYAHHYGYSYN